MRIFTYFRFMKLSQRKSQVILAGAGPGDPDLISVKALKAIQGAQVILYDALVNPVLLEQRNRNCILIFVGKRKGCIEFTQDEINELLYHYACEFDFIVRLKGGDPYVFGRGHEELEYLYKRGILAEVIPGISSAIAAPAAAGIPVTKRGVNESFWIITGTLASGKCSDDLFFAAQSSATVVILMGMTHLETIAGIFSKYRSPMEPVAIVQEATTSRQKMVRGNVSTISSIAKENVFTSPAVIIIGKVVEESVIAEMVQQENIPMKVAV